jgi:hypothetical protein
MALPSTIRILLWAVLAVDGAFLFYLSWKVMLYEYSVSDRIRFDERYQRDAFWRQRAEAAIWSHRATRFAVEHGILPESPQWIRTSTALFVVGAGLACGLFAMLS